MAFPQHNPLKKKKKNVLDAFDNPNDALSAWSRRCEDIIESNALLRSRRARHPTPDIIEAINERDRS